MALDRALACPRLWCAHHWSASNDRVVRLAPFSEPLPPMLLQANDRSVRSCSGRAAALVVRNTRRFHVIDPDGRRWPRFDHRIEIVLASICLVAPAAAQSAMGACTACRRCSNAISSFPDARASASAGM